MVYDKNIDNKIKYFMWYYKFIKKFINRKLEYDSDIHHKHHYIPKSIIPNNDIVIVTHREHYILHKLLVKFLTGKSKMKMCYALHKLTTSSKIYNTHILNKYDISFIKKTYISSCKGVNNNFFGKKHTKESRDKISKAIKGENNGMYGCKHTEKTKNAMSIIKKSNFTPQKKLEQSNRVLQYYKNNPEVKIKISNSIKKLNENPEYKENIKNKLKIVWNSPEKRSLQKNKILNYFKNNPEAKKSLSNKVTEYWSKHKHPRANKIIILGVHYDSLRKASIALGISVTTISRRLKDNLFTDYLYSPDSTT